MNKRLISGILTLILFVIPCAHALGQQDMPFDPAQLAELDQATLFMNLIVPDLPNSGTYVRTLTNPDKLATLAKLLSEAEKLDHGSGCGFEKDIAFLVLRTKNGQVIRLAPAPDSCTVYQTGGAYYYFMPKEDRGKPNHPDNRILYDLFDPSDAQVTESVDAAAEFSRLIDTVKAERQALSPIWGHPNFSADVWDYLASSPHRHLSHEQLQAEFGEQKVGGFTIAKKGAQDVLLFSDAKNSLYLWQLDGNSAPEVMEGISASALNADEHYAYFANAADGYKVYQLDLETGAAAPLSGHAVKSIYVFEDYLAYEERGDTTLYVMPKAGGQAVRLGK